MEGGRPAVELVAWWLYSTEVGREMARSVGRWLAMCVRVYVMYVCVCACARARVCVNVCVCGYVCACARCGNGWWVRVSAFLSAEHAVSARAVSAPCHALFVRRKRACPRSMVCVAAVCRWY
jgi:hypothetical protein